MKMLDMFGIHVVAQYDMPICRVILGFGSCPTENYVIDLSDISFYCKTQTESRVQKYKNRLSKNVHNPCTMAAGVLFSFLKPM